MSEEQLLLITTILANLCQASFAVPYYSWGNIDVGQCRWCGVVGKYKSSEINFEHKPECPISLCNRLIASLNEPEEPKESPLMAKLKAQERSEIDELRRGAGLPPRTREKR